MFSCFGFSDIYVLEVYHDLLKLATITSKWMNVDFRKTEANILYSLSERAYEISEFA